MVLFIAVLAAAAAAHMLPLPFLFEAFRPSGSLWHVKAPPQKITRVHPPLDFLVRG